MKKNDHEFWTYMAKKLKNYGFVKKYNLKFRRVGLKHIDEDGNISWIFPDFSTPTRFCDSMAYIDRFIKDNYNNDHLDSLSTLVHTFNHPYITQFLEKTHEIYAPRSFMRGGNNKQVYTAELIDCTHLWERNENDMQLEHLIIECLRQCLSEMPTNIHNEIKHYHGLFYLQQDGINILNDDTFWSFLDTVIKRYAKQSVNVLQDTRICNALCACFRQYGLPDSITAWPEVSRVHHTSFIVYTNSDVRHYTLNTHIAFTKYTVNDS